MGRKVGKNVIRNLFRLDSDSSSSLSDDDDDNNNDTAPTDAAPKPQVQQQPASTAPQSSMETSKLTTITQTIHHVELEMCSMGGSIEHRLWPAATFLTSYILQSTTMHTDNNAMHHRNNNQQHHSTTDPTSKHIQENTQSILDDFRSMISKNSVTSINNRKGLKVLDLGAGIGFTTLELAYHVFLPSPTTNHPTTTNNNIEFLMTDLSSALPLLQRNRQRNFGNVHNANIHVQKLEWGDYEDIQNAISWYKNTNQHRNGTNTTDCTESPLLILGTDCVYWESLYNILETTIASLLQNATPDSICLLANVRRWKRDTNFFQHKFGQCTSTHHGRLHCTCIYEQVKRSEADDYRCNNNCDRESDISITKFENHQDQREIIRIYAIQWITKLEKK